jgi:rhodanese-related sulfurtransferase
MTSATSEREGRPPAVRWFVAGIVLAGSAAPLILYWLLFGRIATVTPQTARRLLQEQGESTVLVDVRKPEEFSAGHIDGAVNWPPEGLLATRGPDDLPPQFAGKTLLLVCDVGMATRWAAWHLDAVGVERAMNVRGGIQEWIHSARGPEGELFDRWRIGADRVVEFHFRRSPVWEQAVAVAAYCFIKPIYTILALALVIVLWKSRSPDLAALRWGMICFFLGENACFVNVSFFKETSYFFEYLHGLGMALCFGFTTYAVLDGIDRRILMLSDPDKRCAALGLCGECIKYADVPCGLKRTFYLIIPLCIAIALMVPLADWQDNAYNTFIFGQFYNYGHLRVHQQFENWYCPAAAILLFGGSLLILAYKRENAVALAKVTFAAGLGPLGFGMLRMVLGSAYDQNRVWYAFWEEFTELLFVSAVGFVLWTFRRKLLPELESLLAALRAAVQPVDGGGPNAPSPEAAPSDRASTRSTRALGTTEDRPPAAQPP